MLGYILFCQKQNLTERLNRAFVNVYLYQLNRYTKLLEYISFIIANIFSLDFSRVFPHICISDKLDDSDALFINYVLSVLFPLFLVIITYILIELHARHFKVVVFCWIPFRHYFNKCGRNWSASDSIIHAFASLLLLFFANLNYDSHNFLVLMKVHAANHVLMNNVPLVYPSLHPYTPKFILYFIIVCVLLLFVGVVPSLLLLLHPIPMFRERLQKCCSQRFLLGLNTFMETFQSPFKDGCNGTPDYRIVPGVGATLFLLAIILDLLAHIGDYENYCLPIFAICFVVITLLCAFICPLKSSSANLSIVFHFMLLAILGVLGMLWKQDLMLDTTVIGFAFVVLLPVPHILMFLWMCYKLEKKFESKQKFCCVF